LGLDHTREALEGLFTPKKANVAKFKLKLAGKPEKKVENKKVVSRAVNSSGDLVGQEKNV